MEWKGNLSRSFFHAALSSRSDNHSVSTYLSQLKNHLAKIHSSDDMQNNSTNYRSNVKEKIYLKKRSIGGKYELIYRTFIWQLTPSLETLLALQPCFSRTVKGPLFEAANYLSQSFILYCAKGFHAPTSKGSFFFRNWTECKEECWEGEVEGGRGDWEGVRMRKSSK